MTDTMGALDNDEFYLDPTRITLLCGAAGNATAPVQGALASEHDIQINKTSRNSVLVQININNTRSGAAHLIKALADMARSAPRRGRRGRRLQGAREVLVEDVGPAGLLSRRAAMTRRAPRRKGTCARRTTWPTTPPISSTSS